RPQGFVRQLEMGLHHTFISAIGQYTAVCTTTKGEAQGSEEDRFARTRFAGDYGQAGSKRQIERFNDGVLADGQAGKHSENWVKDRVGIMDTAGPELPVRW